MQPGHAAANSAQLAAAPFGFRRVVRALVQGSVTALGFGVAIALVCLPFALVGKALHVLVTLLFGG